MASDDTYFLSHKTVHGSEVQRVYLHYQTTPWLLTAGNFSRGFLVHFLFKGACLRPSISYNLISGTRDSISVKFVDDISLGVHVDLSTDLVQDVMKREKCHTTFMKEPAMFFPATIFYNLIWIN